MLFQVLCGFEPIFYTTHPNEESKKNVCIIGIKGKAVESTTGNEKSKSISLVSL